MKNILVTGSSGFIGKNLVANLNLNPDYIVLNYDKENDEEDLDNFVSKADFIFHLAGVNRPQDEAEFASVNRDLTEQLVTLVRKHGNKAKILITSSIQAEIDNPYGKSKKAAEDLLQEWSKNTGGISYIYRLQNAFGKWSKPNYNTVVATFCYNIANNIEISVSDPKKEIELVYIDDIVAYFVKKIESDEETGIYKVPTTHKTTLGSLAKIVKSFKTIPTSLLMPDFSDPLVSKLYSTYTSFTTNEDAFYLLEKKSDERGWLAEFIKSAQFGQIFVSTTRPGFTRGKHWHNSKIEKFLVLKGEAEIKIRDYYSDEVTTYAVNGDQPCVAEMVAGSIHSITNTGKIDLVLLIWSNEIFNPDKPDTFFKEVENE